MSQPEGRVKKAIKEFMAKNWPGAWSFMPVQTGYGTHGIPDHIYCVPVRITADMVGSTVGMFVGVEAKTKNGKMTDYQRLQREGITDAFGLHITVYGRDDVADRLSVLDKLK